MLNAACYAQNYQVWMFNTKKPEEIFISLRHETSKANSINLMSLRLHKSECLNVALDGEAISPKKNKLQTNLFRCFLRVEKYFLKWRFARSYEDDDIGKMLSFDWKPGEGTYRARRWSQRLGNEIRCGSESGFMILIASCNQFWYYHSKPHISLLLQWIIVWAILQGTSIDFIVLKGKISRVLMSQKQVSVFW